MIPKKIECFLLVALSLGIGCQTKAPEKKEIPAEKLSSPTVTLKGQGPETATPTQSPTLIPSPPVEETTLPSPSVEEAEEVPFQPQAVQSGLAINLVLDGSGSMKGLLGADTKADLVKRFLKDLSEPWSTLKEPPIHLAIRTFGSQFSTELAQCDDTKLLMPLGGLDPSKITEALSSWTPQGMSPLAATLKEAAKDLPEGGPQVDRVIILLADGADTCNQDPCQTAGELYDSPSKTIIHVIAFDSDEPTLKCIAEKGHGEFVLARTPEELATALDQTFRTTVPYNLKLKILIGGSPLPSTLTVYKAGSTEVVKQETSYGVQLLRLPPGSYDIRVEYSASYESPKPAKQLKGVDLTASGKVEQELRFDLGSVDVSGSDGSGVAVATRFDFFAEGSKEPKASLTTKGDPVHFYLTPGTYDVVATRLEPEDKTMTLTEPKVVLGTEQGWTKQFIFQTGTLVLKGLNSLKEPTPLLYRVTRAGDPNTVVASGTAESAGSPIDLPPGTYDVLVEGQDPVAKVQIKGQLKDILIESGKTAEQTATLISGVLNLKATKGNNDPAMAEFEITDAVTHTMIATITAEKGTATVALTPGKYDVQASYMGSAAIEKPKTEVSGIVIEEGKTKEQGLTFELGTLKILGRNTKEQKIVSVISVFKAGTEDLIDQSAPASDWVQFDLVPGNYDILAEESNAGEAKAQVWLRDIPIVLSKEEIREAVFTNAKVKLVGRGGNNQIIKVQFKIFKYGSDSPLFSGETGDDWLTYSIPPDNYYLEAGWVDRSTDQLLKKWITLKVGENEVVEKVLQF